MKSHIPADLLNQLKTELEEKLVRLKEDEVLVKSEDPYMVEDRDEGNADWQDETLEDMTKTSVDMSLESIARMRMKVEKALAKIESGKYGICEVSGEPIEIDRLKAYPEASTKIEFAPDDEK